MYKYTLEELRAAVEKSYSWSELHRKLSLSKTGPSVEDMKRRCERYEISTSHFDGKSRDMPRKGGTKRRPLSEYLVEDRDCESAGLKKKLLEAGIFPADICSECGQEPLWNGKPLVLHLDHINGVRSDNRLENLRILCPHCHSQTETFGSKNRKVIPPNTCVDCGVKILRQSSRCPLHSAQSRVKIDWPCVCKFDEISKTIAVVARELGVTPPTIKRRLKNHPCKCVDGV